MRNLKCRSVTTESNLTIHLFLNFNTYASDALDGDSKNSDAVSRKNKPTVLLLPVARRRLAEKGCFLTVTSLQFSTVIEDPYNPNRQSDEGPNNIDEYMILSPLIIFTEVSRTFFCCFSSSDYLIIFKCLTLLKEVKR
jgi:hypothetical protein